jgi:hypothetical protein
VNTGRTGYAYAQARLQARLGQSSNPADLDRAHAARDLAGFLAAMRATSLRRYTARLAASLAPHDLERHLRGEWSALVDEVAHWQPAPWQPVIRWLRWLPYLPALQKLARDGRPPAWTRDDPVLGRVVAAELAVRPAVLDASPLRPLRPALLAQGDVAAAWLAHWRFLRPGEPTAGRALDDIVRAAVTLDTTLRDAPPGAGSAAAQRAFAARLLRLFRRHPLSPAAAVAYLGLEGLGLLELRGGALRRAVLAAGAS